MKTATVRELRNNFAKISRWIKDGEKVDITSRGVSLARLVPTPPPREKNKKKLFDLVEHQKWMKEVYKGKVLKGNGVVLMREGSLW
jgi:antitoxin (DNA-binding transcriptional repressor) of toxin-antitoxin stability system